MWINLELIRIQILDDSMPKYQKEIMNKFVPNSDLFKMIVAQRDNIIMRIIVDATPVDKDLKLNMGTNQDIKPPQTEGLGLKKNISE